MAGRGPAPKPADQRARRNKVPGTITLPAAGRTTADGKSKPAPPWPLGADVGVETEIAVAKIDIAAAQLVADDATTARERAAARKRLIGAQRKLATAQELKKLQRSEETKLWRDLWRTPMAVQWELASWTRDVAQYVRNKVKAEAGSLKDASEARQMGAALGLTDLARRNLRWEIEDAAAAAGREPVRRSKRNSRKYGDLRVVG